MEVARRKNVLFITCDQLRADCILRGNKYAQHIQTPHLDRLASQGVTFERHYGQTVPCGPARASMHTSMYALNHGVYDNGVPLRAGLTNWALEISAQTNISPRLIGYVDQAIDLVNNEAPSTDDIHWDGGYLDGLKRLGSTDFIGTKDWLIHSLSLSKDDALFAAKKRHWNGYRGSVEWLAKSRTDDTRSTSKGYSAPARYDRENSDTSILVNRAIRFIKEEAEHGKAWALHLSLLKPHPPWTAPFPYNELYHPDEVEEWFAELNEKMTGQKFGQDLEQHPWLQFLHTVPNRYAHHGASGSAKHVTRQKKLEAMSAYFGLVTELDACLGKLFDFLRVTGEDQRTLIIFTCDHGEQLFNHGLVGKLGFYEESYHIPLIIADPFAPLSHGKRYTDYFTEAIDIAPTIVDWIGATVPKQFQGTSLLSAVRGRNNRKKGKDFVVFEYNFSNWGWRKEEPHLNWAALQGLSVEECVATVIREANIKYIHFNKLPCLLIDLQNDPGETQNVIDIPEYQATLTRMRSKLERWKALHETYRKPIYRLKIVADNTVLSLSPSTNEEDRGIPKSRL